jgi:glycosyltransferase involved in cell wall biosynthesis
VTVITSDAQLSEKLATLAAAGFAGAIVNTAAAARAVAYLRAARIRPVLLMHELPRILREKHLLDHARAGLTQAASVVFSASSVRDAVFDATGLADDDRTLILPQGSYKDVRYDPAAAAAIRAEFGLKAADHLILGVGYADLRKGFDLFLQLWRTLQSPGAKSRFCLVWVGGIDPGLNDWLAPEIAAATAAGSFRMAGYRNDVAALFSAATAFALTSREDPLPTVVMEALGAGCPVTAFDGTGGAPDMLRGLGEGAIVPYGDVAAMARAIRGLAAAPITAAQREDRHAKIATNCDFPAYVSRLLGLALPDMAKISVAVPNYNYARFMPARLASIFQQTYPVQEILVLDDASGDDSLAVIPAVAQAACRSIRLQPNATNSGSVFSQWRRAAERATGDYVWIAEADDLSDCDFLARAAALLTSDPHIVLAFTDSRTIDAAGNAQWDSYKPYYSTIESGALTETGIFEAADFVRRFLAVKNLILNVSAVVWRRDALLHALNACGADLLSYRMAGDWLLYLTALSAAGARIAYESSPLNVHRRHASSVTHALPPARHLAEITRCHVAAATALTLPPATLAAQQAYRAEIAAQLRPAKPARRRSVQA